MLEKIMDLHLLLYAMVVLGGLGALGMLATHLTYRRLIRKNTETRTNLKEKWMNLWKTRDKLLNRMNRLVWYPSLFCTALLGAVFFLYSGNGEWDGMPLAYLYVGAIIPAALLLLRQALDFTYKEELLMNTLSDYVEHVRTWVEEVPAEKKPNEGRNHRSYCGEYPSDSRSRKSFQPDAYAGRGRDNERNHKRIYGIEKYM